MDVTLAAPLRAALLAADFTYDGVAELLGRTAHDALSRNETLPARRRTADGAPLSTLVRLFLLQVPVPTAAAEAALPGLVDRLVVAGLLEQSVAEVAARLDCRPYATDDATTPLWVVSDLTPGLDGGPARVGTDHVLGISSASTSLAQLTVRPQVGRALDLGTGCGVQALHLARHVRAGGRVVATDVNRRALAIARFNAALNEVDDRVEVREGSYFEPVAGERFDLVATNPPFVISPGTGERLVYRDSGLPGDRVVEQIVRVAPRHLTDGGWCQVLGNWVVERGRPWDERLAGWLSDPNPDPTHDPTHDPDERLDALVVQRELIDPAAYVELWLKDAGLHGAPDYLARYDTWLSWFDEVGIEAVGFGWVNLRRRLGGGPPVVQMLEWPYEVEQPVAPAVLDWGAAALAAPAVDAGTRLRLRGDVRQETLGPAGAEDPEHIVLRQQRGLRRARAVDTVEAALAGACDGDLTLGALLDAIAGLLGLDAEQTRATYLPVAAELVAEGFCDVV